MKKNVIWLILSCLMVLSLVLASCGTTVPEEEEEEVIVPTEEEEEVEEEEEEEVVPVAEGPKYGGTITLNMGQALASPNPMQTYPATQILVSYTHDKLGVADWTKGPGGTNEYNFTNTSYFYPYVGALIESWEQTDPYTFVLHLRQGVHWHDKPPVNGREFVADDVVYSVENLLAHPEVQTHIDPTQLVSITATDKYTVEIKSNTLDARFLGNITIGPSVWIRPPEPEATYGAGFTDIDGHCGTGPFVLTDFTSSSAAALERNPDYWAYDELNPENQIPYVDSVKLLMISDSSTVQAALRTAKIDTSGVSVEDADSFKETSPELKYSTYLSNMFLKLSMRQDLEELPFSDIRVRKAMAMAIDREAIVEDYLMGMGEMLTYPLNPNDMKQVYIPLEELPESAREQFEYNPEKAKQLLADAGYPDGFQTECIVVEDNTDDLQIFLASWKAIGIDCEIKVVDRGAWFNLSWGKKYEQMTFGETGTSNPVTVLDERKSEAFFNYDMHFDPDFDAKVDVLIETTDEAEKNKLIQELSISWLDGVNCIQFPARYGYTFWWPWLENYQGEAGLGWHGSGGIFARIWVDQELKKEMGY